MLDYGFLREGDKVQVELSAMVGGERMTWPAVLDRLDGEVQRSTLSAYGLATIRPNAAGELPPVGLFVEASIPGKQLEEVASLPRSAVRGGNEVWVVEDGRLAKRTITILRSTAEELVVRGDFKTGDQLVLTRLAAPMTGMNVQVMAEDTEQ